jgi:hypothetical protein
MVYASGCASYYSYQFRTVSQRPAEYERFFTELDAAVNKAGVRDASTFPVIGFPYLRINRFLISCRDQLKDDHQKKHWVEWMQQLDIESRRTEIHNLPQDFITNLGARLGETPDRSTLYERYIFFSDELLAHDRQQPGFYDTLQNAASVPDEYSTIMRIFGLYPLAALPVALVTNKVFDDIRQWHQLPRDELKSLGTLRIYGPIAHTKYSQKNVNAIFAQSKPDVLGIRNLSEAQRMKLLDTFAPIYFQDAAADYDQIGEVIWKGERAAINPSKPAVYYYFSYARLAGEPALQLNYVIWYAARAGPNSPRIERGLLDGLTVRVSLDSDGRPFMVDIMNNCGCYHFFVPRKESVERIIASPLEIDAFVPRWLPDSFPQERLSLRINSGWHQVDNIGTVRVLPDFVPYQLVPYERLEMLQRSDNVYESIFNSRGIAKNTDRVEPAIFFPMGIPDVGSMRQRGHHAVKMVGRAHFDDPDLFDRNFQFISIRD